MKLSAFITQEALRALDRQDANGAMPPGRNGPYGHSETPLRNTAHWLMTWCQAHQWSGRSEFRTAARKALDYVLSPRHRPSGANWYHRDAQNRDHCNGVIGAAWVIEALVEAHRALASHEALQQALEVHSQHRFNTRHGLWFRLEVDGRILSLDRTFNHQLWFAASTALLAAEGSKMADQQARSFLDGLGQHLNIRRNGLIRHRTRLHWWDRFVEPGSIVHTVYRNYVRPDRGAAAGTRFVERDIGYHAFNLHALARLHQHYPDHPVWQERSLKAAIGYTLLPGFAAALEGNPYGYPYNPVGLEVALALQEFRPDKEEVRQAWIQKQIGVLSPVGLAYGDNSKDPATAVARLYEGVALKDFELDKGPPS